MNLYMKQEIDTYFHHNVNSNNENKSNPAKKMKTIIQNNNEYFICFKKIIYLLKIFAIFPFICLNEKTNLNRLFSAILAIVSLTAYTLVNVKEEMYLYHFSYKELREFSYVNLMRFILQAMLRMLILIFPLFAWNKNKKLRNYWNSWIIFQIKIENVTKVPFKSSTRNQIQGLFVIATVSMMTIGIIMVIAQRRSSPVFTANPFTIFYISHAVAYVATYWVANNMYITGVAKKIKNLVRQALHKGNIADLNRLMYLWILLCDLNDEFINTHSIIFLIIFSAIVIDGVICIFLAVAFFIYLDNDNLGFLYFSATLIFMMGIMTFCESANLVIDQMVNEMKNVLLDEKIIGRKKSLLPGIMLFLHTIEARKPKITFKGYMTIDRSIITSILGAGINFLVVLRQFSPD